MTDEIRDNKSSKRCRPYISIDGRYGDFEWRFEKWYLGQAARSSKMKEMLAVAFGIFEADPIFYGMLVGSTGNEPLTEELLNKLMAMKLTLGLSSKTKVEPVPAQVLRNEATVEAPVTETSSKKRLVNIALEDED